MNPEDFMMGQRFGTLTVTHRAGLVRNGLDRMIPAWRCRCDCGKIRVVAGVELRRGRIFSCKKSEGVTRSSEYFAYHAMRHRCLSKKNAQWDNYGGRGITICERWLEGDGCLSGYECFMADMGPKPSKRHSVDRRDPNGNYEPSNCRWATPAEQALNKRNTVRVIVDGRLVPLTQAAREHGVSKDQARRRMTLHGFSVAAALTKADLRGRWPRKETYITAEEKLVITGEGAGCGANESVNKNGE